MIIDAVYRHVYFLLPTSVTLIEIVKLELIPYYGNMIPVGYEGYFTIRNLL